MSYSSAGILAIIIHLIINHDVMWNTSNKALVPAQRPYRLFLMAITVYYITDICWGFLYDAKLIALCFADTELYFAAMAFSIVLWTQYVIEYLRADNRFGRVLAVVGRLIFIFQMIVIVVNCFVPVLFTFDEGGAYRALAARYATLIVQIVMFLMTAVHVFAFSRKETGTMKRRQRTIGLFSVAMAGFALSQVCFPLLPMYAIGCLLASCVLHSFILENEKDEYRGSLEAQLRESILKGNYYDLLTGLPGMTYFLELAAKRRSDIIAKGDKPAFLYINLSGLKFYNQRRGFTEGDGLLRSLARLLTKTFGDDGCSRFGQDHFAVLSQESGLEERLTRLFREWSALSEGDCPAILVGIYADDKPDGDITSAYDAAKIACDAIDITYMSSFRFFDASMYASAEKAQYITGHLNRAIEEKWIQVYYQPIVRTINERVCDEEALARWIDPDRGFLSPADFIPVLEDARLIYRLDLYIVEQVTEKLNRIREAGLHPVPQSVNLSRSDFESCDIVEEIRRRVDDAGLPRRLITIEITESIIGSDFDFIKSQVVRFRELGFPVWLDDFGSGYSSLDVLQSMPMDLIKFDMRFMQQFNPGQKNRVILAELMRMAIGLGLDTICEGVEREDQVEFLREIGCGKIQGYYYGKPAPLGKSLARYEDDTQIEFEDPNDAGYYETISRINLYDLAEVTKEDDATFQRYYNTVPMAIIEVRGNKAKFTRSNQAYRDFIARVFHLDLAVLTGPFEETPEGPGLSFVMMLRRCCAEGGRAFFDETMPDGSTVHSFVRKIAENPATGTQAAAVAVLAIT